MKKVVLLGDSIRLIGYGKRVEELLGKDYEVWQSADNDRFASYTQRRLFDDKNHIAGADVVHWNNGHWDYCALDGEGPFTPLDVYVETMCRIARWLKANCKRVIFATTTPIRPENTYNRDELLRQYNDAVVPRLRELGVEINDLYTPCAADIYRYIGEDTIHLSAEGVELCAEKIVKAIKEEK